MIVVVNPKIAHNKAALLDAKPQLCCGHGAQALNVSCKIGPFMECLESVTPHIPSKNMKESVNFMAEAFGFESCNHNEFYSELVSGNQILGIIQAHGEPNQQSIYLRVKDIDALWSKIKSKLERAKHKAPFNQEYGMREIHVVIPGTNTLLFVGSPITS